MKFTSTSLLLAGALCLSLGAHAQNSPRAKTLLQKAFSANSGSQRLLNLVSLPGTSQNFASDLAGGWTHYSNSTYTYDLQGRLTERIDRVPDTNQNIYKFTYAFDAQGNETEVSYYDWASNQWVKTGNSYKSIYTYNASNKPTEIIDQKYNETSLTYVNDYRTVITYNAAGYAVTDTYYEYDNNSWVSLERFTYTFTSPTAPPTGLLVEVNTGSGFENDMRYTDITWHNYDLFQVQSFTGETWDGTAWELSQRINTTYDSFGGSVQLMELHNGTSWEPGIRTTQSYDTHSNYTGTKAETWVGSGWQTDYEAQEVLTYNANDDITQRLFRNTFNISGTLEDDRKELYDNFVYVTAAPANTAELPVSVFPNPAVDKLYVSGQLTGAVHATVTDLTGRTVLTQVVEAANGQLNVSGLTAGTYLLTLHNQAGSKTAKIVKL